jgi:hypothetical protein
MNNAIKMLLQRQSGVLQLESTIPRYLSYDLERMNLITINLEGFMKSK